MTYVLCIIHVIKGPPLSLTGSASCWFNYSHFCALLQFNSCKWREFIFPLPLCVRHSSNIPIVCFIVLFLCSTCQIFEKSQQLQLFSQPHAVLIHVETERESQRFLALAPRCYIENTFCVPDRWVDLKHGGNVTWTHPYPVCLRIDGS